MTDYKSILLYFYKGIFIKVMDNANKKIRLFFHQA